MEVGSERGSEQEISTNLGDIKSPSALAAKVRRTEKAVKRIVQEVNQRHHPFVLKIAQEVILTAG